MTFFGNMKDLPSKPRDIWRHTTPNLFGETYKLHNERQEWETPKSIFNYFDKKYNLDHDACASLNNHLKKSFWTVDDNSLLKDWKGKRVWCNPPWGNSQKDLLVWSQKARTEGSRKNTLVAFLFPINTSANFFIENIMKAESLYCVIGNPTWTRPAEDGSVVKSKLPFNIGIAIFNKIPKEQVAPRLKVIIYKDQKMIETASSEVLVGPGGSVAL